MVTVAMFQWMGLGTNMEKTKSIVCDLGFIWGMLSDTMYNQRVMGGVFFPGTEMNLVQLHIVQGGGSGVFVKYPHGEATRVDFSTDACVRGGGGGPATYVVYLSRVLKTVHCSLPACPSIAHSAVRIW